MTELAFPADDNGTPWPRLDPAEAGFDAARLADAVAFAEAQETPWSRDLAAVIAKAYFEPPPWNETLGPVKPRGGPNGLVTRHGRLVARWGDTRQVDMTFSIAKSYLSILAGVAHDRGLLPDPREPVGLRVQDGGFEPPHNAKITWEHLLQQTSEWEGTLWDKPDLVDRNRDLAAEGTAKSRKGTPRILAEPGRYWEYNDVRVNRLSLALLRLFRRPLPEVFAEAIMAPIGASSDWQWHGYRNSTVEIDGKTMVSVPGGSHWGGGVFIHAEDQARLGLLMLARGEWRGRRLLSAGWIARATAPCDINPNYGYFWWLNTNRGRYPSASPESFFASGAGGNSTWIDPNTGIVAVMRWMNPAAIDGFIGRVMAALEG
ncbi:MAG TPA: serine hydrolase [Alphaproteobacteria bacterium]|nr:serine hydrolase [Alphaproteobacteria bacterium]